MKRVHLVDIRGTVVVTHQRKRVPLMDIRGTAVITVYCEACPSGGRERNSGDHCLL